MLIEEGRAALQEAEKVVCENVKILSLKIIGAKRKEKRFIKKVGIKSREDNFVEKEWISLLISTRIAEEKFESCEWVKSNGGKV